MKTFINWQGNKTRYLKHILPLIPDNYNTYIEPFVGSGALLLKLEPKKWIINDLNKDLINVWKTIKNNKQFTKIYFKKFAKKFIPLTNDEKIKMCVKITNTIENLPYDEKRASIFILMKFCSYMGHIMKKNIFIFQGLNCNIFLKNQYYFLTEKYFDLLNEIHLFLETTNGKIFNKDYKKILEKAKKNDFIFLDPPYFKDKKYQFNYNKNENIDDSFIETLYSELKKLDKKKVKWLMTQANILSIRKTFKEYNITTIKVYRNISKTYKTELLIKNY